MDSTHCVYYPSLSTCCDIVSRLNNEIQFLFQDMEVLLKKQISFKTMQNEFNDALDDLSKKLDNIYESSCQSANFQQGTTHVQDFILFSKSVWQKLSKYLENDLGNIKYYSTKRGTPLISIVEQLIDFCFHCTYTYATNFSHQHCIVQFKTFSSQLNNVIYPEVEFSDDFEQNYLYIKTLFPCLINLMTITDIYAASGKFPDVESFCNEILGHQITPAPISTLQSPRLLSILTCNYLNSPHEAEASKLKLLLPYIDNITSFILKMSVVPHLIPSGTRLVGILNSPFMDCTQEANILSPSFHLQFNSPIKEVPPYRPDGRRRGRRRCRYSEESYIQIKVPKVQMQPFSY